MNAIHVLLVTAVAFGLAGCSVHRPASAVPPAAAAPSSAAVGTLPAGNALLLDAGVSDVRLVVEPRDSVSWSLETSPAGCAAADAQSGRLSISRRRQQCSTRWDVHVPIIDDIRVSVSVGDIDVAAPANRAIRLRAGVGSVRLSLDGRALRHAGAPGSGDHLDLGDASTLPRLDARTGVGDVRADLHSATSARSPDER